MARFPELIRTFCATLTKCGINVPKRLLPVGISRTMSKEAVMSSAFVRAVDGAERMHLSFKYTSPTGKERLYNFDRSLDEQLDITTARIAVNVAKTLNKKKRKKTQDEQPALSVGVALYHNDVEVNPDLPNKKVWCPGARLRVGEADYVVVVNPPTVISLRLPDNVIAGSIVCPEVKLDFAEVENCNFTWYREKPHDAQNSDGSASSSSGELGNGVESPKAKISKYKSSEWEEIHQGYLYSVKDEDVDHRLRVACLPGCGEGVTAETGTPVNTAPASFPFQRRQECTQHKTPSDRCVCDGFGGAPYFVIVTCMICLFKILIMDGFSIF